MAAAAVAIPVRVDDRVNPASPRREHHAAQMDIADEEEFEFITPIRNTDQDAPGSAVAPGAPMRPLSQTSRRIPSLTAALMDAAPAAPKLEATLQYDQLSLGTTACKLLVKASPPAGMPKPDIAHIFFCVDESYSMTGGGMDTVKAFFKQFFTNGVPGITLYVRIFMFGRNPVDKKLGTEGDLEVACVSEETLPQFLAMVETMAASQGCTDIGTAVLRACNTALSQASWNWTADGGVVAPPATHIICLTDGDANTGMTFGWQIAEKVRELDCAKHNIFTHYIGLGTNIKGAFMEQACDSGKLGVFSWAPTPDALGKAFEEVFGIGLECRFGFELKVDNLFPVAFGEMSERIESFGMLTKDRTVAVDVVLTNFRACAAGPVLRLQLYNFGVPIGEPVEVNAAFAEGPLGIVHPDVQAFLESERLQERAAEIVRQAGTMQAASKRLSDLADEIEKEDEDGSLGNAIAGIRLRSLEAKAVPEADEGDEGGAAVYRSLSGPASVPTSGSAVGLFAARISSLRAYT